MKTEDLVYAIKELVESYEEKKRYDYRIGMMRKEIEETRKTPDLYRIHDMRKNNKDYPEMHKYVIAYTSGGGFFLTLCCKDENGHMAFLSVDGDSVYKGEIVGWKYVEDFPESY